MTNRQVMASKAKLRAVSGLPTLVGVLALSGSACQTGKSLAADGSLAADAPPATDALLAADGTGDSTSNDRPCTAEEESQFRAFVASLAAEYQATLTYDDGSAPATKLTLQLANEGAAVVCHPVFDNGGELYVEVGAEMGFRLSTEDGAFNESFSAELLKGGPSHGFSHLVQQPHGAYKPGVGYTPALEIDGQFEGGMTTGQIWKQKVDCGCGGKPGCACPSPSGIVGRWQ